MSGAGDDTAMERAKVYIETTIPSFYHATRSDAESVSRRTWTRQWWDTRREEYNVVTSAAVLDELKKRPHPAREDALALMERIPLVAVQEAVEEIVEAYVRHRVMPTDPRGDAMHLALASYHQCEFLLTWNCQHLANANKFRHISRVNTMLGLYVPALVTPLELLGVEP